MYEYPKKLWMETDWEVPAGFNCHPTGRSRSHFNGLFQREWECPRSAEVAPGMGLDIPRLRSSVTAAPGALVSAAAALQRQSLVRGSLIVGALVVAGVGVGFGWKHIKKLWS